MSKRITEILSALGDRSIAAGELDKLRRDITLLFSDLKGSTSYFEHYGDGAGLALVYRCTQLQRSLIVAAGGSVVKTMGDGLMARFDDPVAALRTAIAIQRAVTQQNVGKPEEHHATLRIGLNCGLGIVKSDDVFGDVVNVASRVQSSAGPGQIAISAELFARVARVPEFRFQPAGKKSFKGKSEPQEVYLMEWMRQPAAAVPQAPEPQTIAACLQHINPDGSASRQLPFANAPFTVGRGPADVEFPADPAMLPQHAKFFVENGELFVEPADERAIAFVSLTGVRALKPGDVIKMGQQLFRYEEAEGALAAAQQVGTTLTHIENLLHAPVAQLVNLNNPAQRVPVRDEEITFGRAQGTCAFPADVYMSRLHARIRQRGVDVFLEDCGSRNGTFVQAIGRTPLAPGVKIQLGGQMFWVATISQAS